jgi:hypothetical protein
MHHGRYSCFSPRLTYNSSGQRPSDYNHLREKSCSYLPLCINIYFDPTQFAYNFSEPLHSDVSFFFLKMLRIRVAIATYK